MRGSRKRLNPNKEFDAFLEGWNGMAGAGATGIDPWARRGTDQDARLLTNQQRVLSQLCKNFVDRHGMYGLHVYVLPSFDINIYLTLLGK
ncbi:hypothetical protein VN12_00900 [Pirellula sp. SH-Sr6A]|nr:hypothetical protein VN12_00900 [Pirellula sp. SH-Sr6A]